MHDSMSGFPQIRQTVEETLGVTISTDWWTACCDALSSAGFAVDIVLSHILVSDLRDVVRPSSTTTDASRQLQLAIQQSQNSSTPKQQLPSTFHLLCQLEEAVDMSLTQEARLSNHPTKPSRCLKLFLTDGIHYFVGVEVLPFLSQWTPGSKLRLQGPLTIRWGLLQLHSGNATFLGGQVEELVKAQAKAREQAQKIGGVGVDATIRALIGTNPVEEEMMDEGEGESGDVLGRPLVSATAHDRTLAEQSTPTPVLQRPSNYNSNQNPPSWQPASVPAPFMTLQHVPHTVNDSGGQNSATRVTAIPTNTASSSRRNVNDLNVVGNHQTASVSARQSVNPYQQRSTDATPTTRSVSETTNITSTLSSRPETTIGDITPLPPRTLTTLNPYSSSTTASRPISAIPTQAHDCNIHFTELRTLLLRGIQEPTSVETQLSKTFNVTLIQKGGNLHFNIGKEKCAGKKQYNFEIHATFGVLESPYVIACKLPSRIIEPLFQKSPAELRALTRTDRQASNRIVEEGGTRVRQEYFGKLRTWKATLIEGTQSMDDIQNPILILEPV